MPSLKKVIYACLALMSFAVFILITVFAWSEFEANSAELDTSESTPYITMHLYKEWCGYGGDLEKDRASLLNDASACMAYTSAVIDSLMVMQVGYPDFIVVCDDVYKVTMPAMNVVDELPDVIRDYHDLGERTNASTLVILAMQRAFPCQDAVKTPT